MGFARIRKGRWGCSAATKHITTVARINILTGAGARGRSNMDGQIGQEI